MGHAASGRIVEPAARLWGSLADASTMLVGGHTSAPAASPSRATIDPAPAGVKEASPERFVTQLAP